MPDTFSLALVCNTIFIKFVISLCVCKIDQGGRSNDADMDVGK